MALILGIDTSTPVCSVALSKDGEKIHALENREGLTHASHLTLLIQDLFKGVENYTIGDIDAVAVSMGPGSYTGLRIGVSTAKGICYGLNKKLVAVSSLEVMAWSMVGHSQVKRGGDVWLCPMIDARRMEVYTAFFDTSMNQKSEISAEIIEENSFKDILDQRKVVFFGNGSEKCQDTIGHPNAVFVNDIHPLAENLSVPAFRAFQEERFEDVAYFEPFYLKDFVATTPKNKVL